MLTHIELKFCIWLCFTVLQIKFGCHQFASIFVGVIPPLELIILKIHSFPHFFLTCFDILSWYFAYDFVILYFIASWSVINLRQFLWELCPFWNLEYWKYTVFRIFLWHALIYWAEILHMPLFYCTTDQVRVLSTFVGVMPLLELRVLEYEKRLLLRYIHHFKSDLINNMDHMRNIELKFCIWLCFSLLQSKFEWHQFASIFVRVIPLLEPKILKIYSFPHFALTCFDILSWNFAYDFVLLYYRSSSSVVNFCRSYAPFGT